ncbi:MAG: DMT family transporter [Clostridia bacterium]|nr:DMT family transporter [Clostridia bacterium]
MFTGIMAGVTWALETVILGIALGMTPFISGVHSVFLAPFVSTFLHDSFSAVYMWIINILRGEIKNVLSIFKSKNVLWLVLASAIGGPVGMTGYVLAVNYMGSSVGAVASAVYPAIGSVLAYFFLKEKIKWYQWIFLIMTLAGVFGLSYSPDLNVKNFWLGLLGAFMCAFGWGIEGVILSKCFKDNSFKSEYALQIRQSVSALIYGIIILPCIKGWSLTVEMFNTGNVRTLLFVACAALCATVSYLFYYKAIAKLGVSKAMGLNITYTAWAILFSVILIKDYSILNFTTVTCAVVVVVCGIFAATDFKELFKKHS